MRDPDDYVGVDFPPIVIGNKVPLEFNFDRTLATGETIAPSPMPVWSIWVIDGTDTDAISRLTGSATIDEATQQRTQQALDVSGLLAGVYYGLRASIVTSIGAKLSLSSRIKVNAGSP